MLNGYGHQERYDITSLNLSCKQYELLAISVVAFYSFYRIRKYLFLATV